MLLCGCQICILPICCSEPEGACWPCTTSPLPKVVQVILCHHRQWCSKCPWLSPLTVLCEGFIQVENQGRCLQNLNVCLIWPWTNRYLLHWLKFPYIHIWTNTAASNFLSFAALRGIKWQTPHCYIKLHSSNCSWPAECLCFCLLHLLFCNSPMPNLCPISILISILFGL